MKLKIHFFVVILVAIMLGIAPAVFAVTWFPWTYSSTDSFSVNLRPTVYGWSAITVTTDETLVKAQGHAYISGTMDPNIWKMCARIYNASGTLIASSGYYCPTVAQSQINNRVQCAWPNATVYSQGFVGVMGAGTSYGNWYYHVLPGTVRWGRSSSAVGLASNTAIKVPIEPTVEKVGKNSSGKTYGSAYGKDPSNSPDLIEVLATNGRVGYVFENQLDAVKDEDKTPIPVYDVSGEEEIGEFLVN